MEPVRQVPLAQIEPDPFNGVQLRRVGWQPEQRQIGWNCEVVAGVPSGAVKHHHGMFVLGQSSRKLPQEFAHRHGGDGWQHQAEITAGGRFDRGEGINKCVALIDRPGRPAPTQPPATAGPALLSKPGFILEKQPDPLARMRLGGCGQTFGQLLF